MFLKRLIQEKIQDIHFRDVLRGGLLFLIFRGLAIPAGFAFTWLVSKYYGANILGVCTVLFSIWGVVEVGVNSSIRQYMVRNLTLLYQQGRTGLYQASILKVLNLGTVFAVIVTCGLMLLADVIAGSFFDTSYRDVIFYTAPVLVVLTISSILQEYLRLSKKTGVFNFLSLAAHSIFALLLLLVLHYAFSFALNPLWAHLAAIGCTFLLSVMLSIRNREKASQHDLSAQPDSYADMLHIMGPLFVSSAAANLSYQMPLFLLSYFQSEHAAGTYAVLFTLSRVVALPLMVVNYNLAPKFAELLHAGQYSELQGLLHKNSRILTIVSAVLFCIIIGFPETILSLMGSGYSGYSTELLMLCGAQLVNVWAGSVNILMVTSGNEKALLKYNLLILVSGTLFGWLLIATFGLMASVAIRAGIMIILNILLSIYLQQKLGLRTFWWFVKNAD